MKAKTTNRILQEAVNLRRDLRSPEIWRRTGMPEKVSSSDVLPFMRISPHGDDREIVFFTGPDNGLWHRVETDGVPAPGSAGTLKKAGTLPAEPILADSSAPGVIRLLVSHAPDQYLTYDSSLNVIYHGAMPPLPEILFTAGEFNTLYETVGPLKLTGTSTPSAGGSLSPADEALLTGALTDAYDAVRARCRSLNYCLQPVLVRYRLLDASGSTVAAGPAVLVGAPGGFSCTDSIVQTSSDSLATLTSGRLTAGVFRPCVIAPEGLPAPWNRLVSKLVIEMSEEIEPLDRSVAAGYGMRYQSAQATATITSCLPGFSRGTVIDEGRLGRLVEDAVAAKMRTVAEFSYPFGGGMGAEGTVRALPSGGNTRLQDQGRVAEALQSMARSYSAALGDGGMTVLCNPLYEPLRGWSPACFIAGRVENPQCAQWKVAFSVLTVTPAGSQSVLREFSGNGDAPASFGPLLMFPSSDATEVTVTYLHPSGTVYEETFPLSPEPVTGVSRYVCPGGKRITLSRIVAAYQPEGTDPAPRLQQGVAEIFPTSDLRSSSGRMRITEGEIRAIRVAPRSRSGWDFSRRKLLFFGDGGTFLATIDGAGRFHSVAPVDNRVLRSRHALCEATSPSGASLVALVGGDLAEVSGQKVTTLRRGVSGDSIGWCEARKEIWIASGPELYRFSPDGEIIRARLPGITDGDAPLRLAMWRGELLAGVSSGVYCLSREEDAESLEIRLRERLLLVSRPERLTVNCFASVFRGRFLLRGDRGTEIPEELLCLSVEGAVNEAVSVRLASPWRPWQEVTVEGAASPDLAIHPFGLE